MGQACGQEENCFPLLNRTRGEPNSLSKWNKPCYSIPVSFWPKPLASQSEHDPITVHIWQKFRCTVNCGPGNKDTLMGELMPRCRDARTVCQRQNGGPQLTMMTVRQCPSKLAKNGIHKRPAGCIVSVAAPPFALPSVLLNGGGPSK